MPKHRRELTLILLTNWTLSFSWIFITFISPVRILMIMTKLFFISKTKSVVRVWELAILFKLCCDMYTYIYTYYLWFIKLISRYSYVNSVAFCFFFVFLCLFHSWSNWLTFLNLNNKMDILSFEYKNVKCNTLICCCKYFAWVRYTVYSEIFSPVLFSPFSLSLSVGEFKILFY